MVLVLPALVISGGSVGGQESPLRFGGVGQPTVETVRAQAEAWLKEIGKADEQTRKSFEAIWGKKDTTVLDRVTDTIVMADPEAAKLLAASRDNSAPAPMAVPAVLKNEKTSLFFRANLGLAYARALSNRRVYEEALEVLKGIKAEEVAEPAAYLFHRAVAEHALLKKGDATRTIVRLLEDAEESPERYKTVSALMLLDMQAWKEKDLAAISRVMENIERRLGHARGGPQTQKMQKQVIARLDELIKELENKAKPPQGPGGGDPQGGTGKPGDGADKSFLPKDGPNKGTVDTRRVETLRNEWGRMPARDRERALQELTQGMSPRYREAIENYFRNLVPKAGMR